MNQVHPITGNPIEIKPNMIDSVDYDDKRPYMGRVQVTYVLPGKKKPVQVRVRETGRQIMDMLKALGDWSMFDISHAELLDAKS